MNTVNATAAASAHHQRRVTEGSSSGEPSSVTMATVAVTIEGPWA